MSGAQKEEQVNYFANTDARGRRTRFGIKNKDRTKHIYVIGKTGMGKSTMLENMAIEDIQNGEGLAFIDPHGKTADLLLDYVPKERAKDVLYFAPFDMEHPIAFNVMEDVGRDKRHLVVAGLMSSFKKIWVDAWSARMEYILQNCLQALLEYPGATLLSINRMLADKKYREAVVANVTDPSTKSFWMDEFAKYTERFAAEATPAIQNKVGQFTSNPVIRNIVGQPKSSFDLRQILDNRKILIVNLSKGLVGEGNANLLGSMLVTKIYLAAMSRADAPAEVMRNLPNFYLYVDEFQSFANESFADILSESRKYKLNLTMAHQYIEQMSEEVRAAVFGNVGTMVSFRVGAYDAEVLEKEFAPRFTAEDLVNLGFTQIYLKLMIDGVSSQPFSATTLPPIEPPISSSRSEVISSSRTQYGRPRAEVERSVEDQLRAPVFVGQAPSGAAPGASPLSNLKSVQNANLARQSVGPATPMVSASPSLSGLRNALAGTFDKQLSKGNISSPPPPSPVARPPTPTPPSHSPPAPTPPPPKVPQSQPTFTPSPPASKPPASPPPPPQNIRPQNVPPRPQGGPPRGESRPHEGPWERRAGSGVQDYSGKPAFRENRPDKRSNQVPPKFSPKPGAPSEGKNQLKEALAALMKEQAKKNEGQVAPTPKTESTTEPKTEPEKTGGTQNQTPGREVGKEISRGGANFGGHRPDKGAEPLKTESPKTMDKEERGSAGHSDKRKGEPSEEELRAILDIDK